jgi:uncharacterized protein YcfL
MVFARSLESSQEHTRREREMSTDVVNHKPKSRFARWAFGVAGVAMAIAGAAKLAGAMTLPSCGSDDAVQIVRELVKQSTQLTVAVSEEKLVTEGEHDRTCSARIQATDGSEETAQITYRIFWDGWSKMVHIQESKPV